MAERQLFAGPCERQNSLVSAKHTASAFSNVGTLAVAGRRR